MGPIRPHITAESPGPHQGLSDNTGSEALGLRSLSWGLLPDGAPAYRCSAVPSFILCWQGPHVSWASCWKCFEARCQRLSSLIFFLKKEPRTV